VRKARREQYLRYPGRDVTANQVAPAARRLRRALAKDT
jgi:hypothetical protein